MKTVSGLHHITGISGPAQQNLDFYAGVLGMRLVKRSVNQDDPKTYHLFYADAEGSPGTDLTFFPWDHLAPSRKGVGLTTEVQLAVSQGSLGYWQERLARYGIKTGALESRFGELSLPLTDPDGLELSLVESSDTREFASWAKTEIPTQKQIMGLHGARMWQRNLQLTGEFLTNAMGFKQVGHESGWTRFVVNGGGSGKFVDVKEMPNMTRGQWGTGSVHHLAWRVDDTPHEMAVREQISQFGASPTPQIDRFWFKSVYYREPGGVVFELATDGPGFGVDEAMENLGEQLVLPPWLEANRAEILAGLPRLEIPFIDKPYA